MAAVPGNPSMAQRIARLLPALSRSHRQIADWVLAHPLQAAAMPIDELAATVGVSVATANRFARALEFDGYAQFRAALVLGFETTLAPVEKLRSKLERSATVADVFASTLSDIQRNIQLTRQWLDPQSCQKAVDEILKAQRIYIVGYGSSSWLGGLLQRSLDPHCDNVQLLATPEAASYGAKVLSRARHGDLLVAIAFPRYLADTVRLAALAREAGVPVLALTDRVSSPLAPVATVALYAQTDSHYFANSEASVLALIEALASAVAHRAKGSVKAATQLAESVLPWLHRDEGARARAPAAAAPRRHRRSPTTSKVTK
ncbi:MurR/RpiR family transcriptional regulator [Ramlibacter sp.]|uniref:MurR/RpiR family transcriptional regulator n=1 Tax=Ramlibacter sp. TaxID=1917967 RepID=UPI002CC6DBE5|nr:MurR/RpiR family transcriptional regulator [Ramlibacter sp.]HWI82614.1 MurR/RpiR family transcriptional regulator [Ramlibacter sp.]